MVHLKFKKSGYHYSWKKPNTIIHNIVFGTLWAEHVRASYTMSKSVYKSQEGNPIANINISLNFTFVFSRLAMLLSQTIKQMRLAEFTFNHSKESVKITR